jgi:hypothetical protein
MEHVRCDCESSSCHPAANCRGAAINKVRIYGLAANLCAGCTASVKRDHANAGPKISTLVNEK